MAVAKKKSTSSRRPVADASADDAVARYLDALHHPLKPAVVALRRVILDASPDIEEGIKWNAPSFRVRDDFATMNLRSKGGATRLWVVLHAGAKARGVKLRGHVRDPEGLVEWLADDRGVVTFENEAEVASRAAPFAALIRDWIRRLA
ncbi:MAG TPA: DUF1801 domain-containing protein [Vicinamibacterales bacterium]|nr:DUF1801 domain-containing protein [Vicinamibacterales bacterium]